MEISWMVLQNTSNSLDVWQIDLFRLSITLAMMLPSMYWKWMITHKRDCPTPWLYLWISEPALQLCCGEWEHFPEGFCYRALLFIVTVSPFIHWAVPTPCINLSSTYKKYKIMIFVFLDFITTVSILRNLLRICLFHS